jgi:hypothetical protein
MFELVTITVGSTLDLSKVVLAIGGLGTAAYGLVDACKGFGGGISNRGLGDIKKVVRPLIAGGVGAPSFDSAWLTLRANWLNGMALGDQKSAAKALIKLNLTAANAEKLATATGVDQSLLENVAKKIAPPLQLDANGKPIQMTAPESDVYGRFDVSLSALLDQAYQRADQRYRNSAKLLAFAVAIALSLVGSYTVYGKDMPWLQAFIVGALATPLAPVAKDISSAIQAGAKVAQALKG